MPASAAYADTQRVTHTRSARKNPAQIHALTRHPTAVAAALAHLLELQRAGDLRPMDLVVGEVLITQCDREGLYWGKVTGELARLTGRSPNRIRVSLRALRKQGVVDWLAGQAARPLPPAQELPRARHVGARQTRPPRRPRVRRSVGKTRGEPSLARRWHELGRIDPNGSTRSDPNGSTLRSSGSSSKNLTRTAHPVGAGAASPGGSTADEPSLCSGTGARPPAADGPTRIHVPADTRPTQRDRPRPEQVASETPSAPAAALASNRGPRPAEPKQEPKGGRPDSDRSPGEPPASVTAAQMAADVAALFRAGGGLPAAAQRRGGRLEPPDRNGPL